MPNRTKLVFRDNESGRLITEYEAENRDPSTYTEEHFSRPAPKSQALWRRDMPNVEQDEQ